MITKRIRSVIVITCVCFFMTACKENEQTTLSGEPLASRCQQESIKNEEAELKKIIVYVNGAVRNPGVYTLNEGDRIYQAVDKAGGMTSKAEKGALNLAETVVDAQNIYVMTKKEYKNSFTENTDIPDRQDKDVVAELVNINTADKDKLITLPGVGESKAAAIIAYREENGQFSSKEEIKNVSGIGDATYANIEDLITTR